MWVTENGELSHLFGPAREEVRGGSRKSHHEEHSPLEIVIERTEFLKYN
jgi:hypothetical protein